MGRELLIVDVRSGVSSACTVGHRFGVRAALVLGAALALLVGPLACTHASVAAGYLHLDMGGEIGFARGSQNVSGRASVEEGFGQSNDVGSPYARVEVSRDGGVVDSGLFASAFVYDERGQGTLTASYGNIVAGTEVASDFRLVNTKFGAYLSFSLADTVFIRPGIAFDLFLPEMVVETTRITPAQVERIDDPLGVPLPYLQVGFEKGSIAAFAEVGYLPLDTDDIGLGSDYDVDSRTLDVEAMLRYRPARSVELFAGYRLFALEVEGRLQGDSVDIDLDLSGLMVGGGLYW